MGQGFNTVFYSSLFPDTQNILPPALPLFLTASLWFWDSDRHRHCELATKAHLLHTPRCWPRSRWRQKPRVDDCFSDPLPKEGLRPARSWRFIPPLPRPRPAPVGLESNLLDELLPSPGPLSPSAISWSSDAPSRPRRVCLVHVGCHGKVSQALPYPEPLRVTGPLPSLVRHFFNGPII